MIQINEHLVPPQVSLMRKSTCKNLLQDKDTARDGANKYNGIMEFKSNEMSIFREKSNENGRIIVGRSRAGKEGRV
jgi:hypothetical protein